MRGSGWVRAAHRRFGRSDLTPVGRWLRDVLGLGAHSRAEVLPTESGHARVRLATGLVAVQVRNPRIVIASIAPS